MIRYKCVGCGLLLESPVSMSGKPDVCPGCGVSNSVPERHGRRAVITWAVVGIGLVAVLAVILTMWPARQKLSDAQLPSTGNLPSASEPPSASVPGPSPSAPSSASTQPEEGVAVPLNLVAGEPIPHEGNILGYGHFSPQRRVLIENGIMYLRYLTLQGKDETTCAYEIWPLTPSELRLGVSAPAYDGEGAPGLPSDMRWIDQPHEIRAGDGTAIFRSENGKLTAVDPAQVPAISIGARALTYSKPKQGVEYHLAQPASALLGAYGSITFEGTNNKVSSTGDKNIDLLRTGGITHFVGRSIRFIKKVPTECAVVLILENRGRADATWEVLSPSKVSGFAEGPSSVPATAVHVGGVAKKTSQTPQWISADGRLRGGPRYTTEAFVTKIEGSIMLTIHPKAYCEVAYVFPGTVPPDRVVLGSEGTFPVTRWVPHR